MEENPSETAKNVVKATKANNEELKESVSIVAEIQAALRANVDEITKGSEAVRIQRKAYRDLGGVLSKVLNSQQGISELDTKQLKKQLELAKVAKSRLALLKDSGQLNEEEADLIDSVIKIAQEELELQQKINQTIGLTGIAFENLNKIGQRAFGGLGINLGTLEDSFKDVSKAIKEKGEEIVKSSKEGEKLGTLSNRFKTFGVALKPLAKGLKDVFTDPVILIKGLADAFFDINKASVDLRRETGQTISFQSQLNTSAATTVDLMNLVVESSKTTGLNIQNVFSGEVLAGAAEFKNLMGGTANEALALMDISKVTGASTDETLSTIVDTVNTFNAYNKTAISHRGVMRDVLTASEGVKASLAGNPAALTAAASAARKLGLSLAEIDSIADQLLNFESSISNELEAQLLTGRNINLTKARELALNNDLAGVSEEIFKNQVTVAEFSQMNRIQQEGLAKALGLNRDQLAKMAFQQARLNGLTAEQAALAAGVSVEDMQRMEIQENFQKVLQKTAQIFSPLLDLVGNFLSLPWVPQITIWGIIAAKAFSPLGGMIKGLIGGITKLFTGGFSLTSMFTGLTAAKTADTVATGAQTTANTALAGSQAAVATTSNTAAVASRGFGAGLASLAAGGMAAVPVLLSIAAAGVGIGAAFAGIGFGIKMAAEGIIMLVNSLTLEKVKVLAAAATSILALSGALGAFAITGVLALPALLAVTPLIKNMADTSGQAGTAAGEGSLKAVEEKLDKLIEVVQKGGNVYIDGNKAGEALVLGSYKSS